MQGLFLEHMQLVDGFPPRDLSAGPNEGDWVSLKHASRLLVEFTAGVGVASNNPALTLEQARDVDGLDAAPLAIPPTGVFRKQAAADLTAEAVWTDASEDIIDDDDDNMLTNDDAGAHALQWVIDLDPAARST